MSGHRSRTELRSRGEDEDRSPPTEPEPSASPGDLLLRLQRGAGNAAVGRLLRDELAPAPRAIARLKTSAQFITHSTGLIEYDRSIKLQEVDTALADYDLVRTDTLEKRQQALYDLGAKIQSWKRSKSTATDPDAWKKSHRKKAIVALDAEHQAELTAVQDAIRQAKAAADKAKMDPLVPDQIKAMTDPVAKGKAVFGAFMTEFRGNTAYAATTAKDTTIWDKSGKVACSRICTGLVELLKYAGLNAKYVEIAPKNFVTKKLGAEFIDAATEGNVRLPGGTFAAEKRFFFNKHWIVEVEGGALYLDPTSGMEVSKDAPEIIDYVLTTTESSAPPVYTDGTWRASHVGNNKMGDGAYELTRVGAKAPGGTNDTGSDES